MLEICNPGPVLRYAPLAVSLFSENNYIRIPQTPPHISLVYSMAVRLHFQVNSATPPSCKTLQGSFKVLQRLKSMYFKNAHNCISPFQAAATTALQQGVAQPLTAEDKKVTPIKLQQLNSSNTCL